MTKEYMEMINNLAEARNNGGAYILVTISNSNGLAKASYDGDNTVLVEATVKVLEKILKTFAGNDRALMKLFVLNRLFVNELKEMKARGSK